MTLDDADGVWAGPIKEIGAERSWDARLVLRKASTGGSFVGTYSDSGSGCVFFVKSGEVKQEGLWFETVGGSARGCKAMQGVMRFVVVAAGTRALRLKMYVGHDPKYEATLSKVE